MAGDDEGGVTEMLQVEEESEEEAFKQAYAVVYADNEAHFKPKAPDSNIEFDNKDLPPENRKWIDEKNGIIVEGLGRELGYSMATSASHPSLPKPGPLDERIIIDVSAACAETLHGGPRTLTTC